MGTCKKQVESSYMLRYINVTSNQLVDKVGKIYMQKEGINIKVKAPAFPTFILFVAVGQDSNASGTFSLNKKQTKLERKNIQSYAQWVVFSLFPIASHYNFSSFGR